jgi:molybdate-binding protein
MPAPAGACQSIIYSQAHGRRATPTSRFRHNAVAAAIAQGRADWGVAIAPVAKMYGLGFLPIASKKYDFLRREDHRERPAGANVPHGVGGSGHACEHSRAMISSR